jgi:hypothetical protein
LVETLPIGGFENHVFISYAHIDNLPLTPEQHGWVTRFHGALDAMLSMRLGRRAKIWRDAKLSGTDVFADEIVAQFPKTALLVSIVSPRYIESEWCTREVAEFCKVAEQYGGLIVANKLRLIKIIKTPVESDDLLPPAMRKVLGHNFFVFDQNETPIELDAAFGEEIGRKYNLEVAKLAWDIAQAIKKLNGLKGNAEGAAQPSSKPAIYLAECSYDCRAQREALETDLRVHGYSVFPDRQLPRDETEYVTEVTSILQKCRLSIHLVGKNYGAVPDGPTQKSVAVLQNDLAIQRNKAGSLSRIIWLPEGTTSQQTTQQQFIDTLLKDSEAQFGADLVTADFETLKAAIHGALDKISKPRPVAPQSDGAPSEVKSVYLICDERDRKATIPLRKFLKACGVDVQIPLFEGDPTSVREANLNSLNQCDAAIVFYGAGDEYWKRSVDGDLKKVRAYRDKKTSLITYTYLADPISDSKAELIALEEPNLIQAFGEFSDTSLKPVIDALQLTVSL